MSTCGGRTVRNMDLGAARVQQETERAILVMLYNRDEETVWIPKSVISDDSECYSLRNGDGHLIVHEWWAEKNGY